MKILKRMLWILIPVIIVIALPIIFHFTLQSTTPKFIGLQNYLRLFIHDKIFLKAVFNTLLPPLLLALFSGLVLYLVRTFFLNKVKRKWVAPVYYVLLFVIPTLCSCCYRIANIFTALEIAASSANVIMNHLSDYSEIRYEPALITIFWHSALIGAFTCLVFWLIDKLVNRLKRNKKQEFAYKNISS